MIAREWEHAGLRCVLRHGFLGVPCGYVLVPEGHPLFRRNYFDIEREFGDRPYVHGGLTFSDWLPELGEEAGWALGFDMGHCFDYGRTDGECAEETEYLADQLASWEVLAAVGIEAGEAR